MSVHLLRLTGTRRRAQSGLASRDWPSKSMAGASGFDANPITGLAERRCASKDVNETFTRPGETLQTVCSPGQASSLTPDTK